MKYTRQQLIEKIKNNDTEFFQKVYEGYWGENTDDRPDNQYDIVWELNWGDGNDIFVAINFKEEDIIVHMRGSYSSYSDSSFRKVSFGIPFQYTETRYRPATIDEIRDMRIDNLLN